MTAMLPHPGAERRLAAEAAEALEDRHHGVLKQILGEGAVADDAADEPERGRRQGGVDGCAWALSSPHRAWRTMLLRHLHFGETCG